MKSRSLIVASLFAGAMAVAACDNAEENATVSSASTENPSPPAQSGSIASTDTSVTPATPGETTSTQPSSQVPTAPSATGSDGASSAASASADPSSGAGDSKVADVAAEMAMLAKVKSALTTSDFDASKVQVEIADGGTVVLKGELPDQAQIDRVLERVRSVDGVEQVDNQLTSVS